MPYLDIPKHKNKPFVRCTEATGAWQCQLPAWNDKNHKDKWDRPKRLHYSAVRGTSVHDLIENFIVMTEELPKRVKKPRPKEHYKMIWEDVKKPLHKQVMRYEIQRCWINFLKWWHKAKTFYKIRVLYCEKKVWSTIHKCAGTVDIICIMEIHGRDCLVVLDWKSSRDWEITFKFQTSGYQGMCQEMQAKGTLILPRDIPWHNRVVTIILGAPSYLEIWSEFDFQSFLNCLKLYRNPQQKAMQGYCVYCGDYYRCPNRKEYNVELEIIPRGAKS